MMRRALKQRTKTGLPRGWLEVIDGGAQLAAATLALPFLRRYYDQWGAAPAEAAAVMPGDDLVPQPKIAVTRAITIGAPPEDVWAWLVQIGQGRGGFYSFDALENLLRCDIHSADRIIPDLQELHAGDLILLAPDEAPCFRVARAEPPHVLVLAGADPKTGAALPVPATPDEMASTWQWVLHPAGSGQSTRLVVRERYSYPRRQALLWHAIEAVSFVMERRMLHGLKDRAEARYLTASGV